MADGLLRRWVEPPAVTVPPELQEAVGGHPLVAQILARRGYREPAAALAFLDPRAYTAASPEALPGISAACERIERALRSGEPLCVWGDFDVDGQTSTTLLVSALRGLGGQVSFHIPVREHESHGVNREYLAPILASGIRLVVTCDTGITSHDALAYAQAQGAEVIVTDHHDLPETLPPACCIANSRLLPAGHPLAGLPGVGVAYLLADALYRRAGRAAEAGAFLDLVALGIVADLATQTADTRWLLQQGLQGLRQAHRVGLQQLYELAALQPGWLTEEHIGFVIGPRLNAVGRLEDANPVVEFLTTGDAGRARVLAAHLEGLNARRRLLTDQVLRGALAQIEKDPTLLDQAALVLSHPEWPAGVVGIVASELAERYNRPTILLAAPPGLPARGSARSIDGVNISAAIGAQQHLLLAFGGHPMAAGLSIDPANIPAFRRGLSRSVEKALGGPAPRRELAIDGDLGLADLSLDLVADLERLAPFGPGNPPLALAIRGLTIVSTTTIGRDGDHLQLIVQDAREQTQKVIWWRGAGWPLPEGIFDLACVVRASNYRGQRELQVEWIDARPADETAIDLRPHLTVIDQRELAHPLPVLQSLLGDTQAVVWAEADGREKLQAAHLTACDRTTLVPASTLVVWTTPPGRAELQAALAAVQPSSVVMFAVDPGNTTPEAFLKRLAGLARYTREKLDGRVTLARLAAAAGQREPAARLGLQWLAQRGLLSVDWQAGGQVYLGPGSGAPLPQAAATFEQIRALLEETAAYRKYFRTAEKENLL